MARARAHQAKSQYCLVATVELRMIDDTSDRAEIDDLVDRYADGTAGRQWELLDEVFTEDVTGTSLRSPDIEGRARLVPRLAAARWDLVPVSPIACIPVVDAAYLTPVTSAARDTSPPSTSAAAQPPVARVPGSTPDLPE
jgi:hypothetical protein